MEGGGYPSRDLSLAKAQLRARWPSRGLEGPAPLARSQIGSLKKGQPWSGSADEWQSTQLVLLPVTIVWSVVQHDAQQRRIDLNSAVVLDETKLLEFVHEQIDPGARCANHLC